MENNNKDMTYTSRELERKVEQPRHANKPNSPSEVRVIGRIRCGGNVGGV